VINVILVAAVVYGLVCGSFTAMVASSRGRDGTGWFVLGFLFGLLALLAVGFMESKTNANQPKPAGGQRAEPEITAELAEACQRVIQEAVRLHVNIDPVVQHVLEFAARYRRGVDKDVRRTLGVAATAVAESRAALEVSRQQEAAWPAVLVVYRAFAAKRRSYSLGRFPVRAGEIADLRSWREKMEAQAAEHEWDAPKGFTVNDWPPFEIETPSS
jgi:hypothetical protein